MIPNLFRGIRRRFSPFRPGRRRPIVHGTYHKMGTAWFQKVLWGVASHYGLSLLEINDDPENFRLDHDIVFLNHSDVPLEGVGEFVGSHMVRDLRDVVVSGYFYHLWTEESWTRQPSPKYGGRSYQEHLNSLDQEQGLLAEIERLAEYADARKMRAWNYQDPRVFEIKYKVIYPDQDRVFRRLFEHYGFTPRAVERAVEIARRCSVRTVPKVEPDQAPPRSHIRSGKPGEWRTVLGEAHTRVFKERMGDLLILMGYEADLDW